MLNSDLNSSQNSAANSSSPSNVSENDFISTEVMDDSEEMSVDAETIGMSLVGSPSAYNRSEGSQHLQDNSHRKTAQLVTDVDLLKEHVESLTKVRNQLIQASNPVCAQYTQMCLDIFRLWGVQDNYQSEMHVMDQKATQLIILGHIMHENIAHIETTNHKMGYGIDSLMSVWGEFCSNFATFELLSDHVEVIRSHPTIVANATSEMKVVFSHQTLVEYFPNVLKDEQTVRELLGMETSVVLKRWFYFNEDAKCVFLKTHIEFLTGFVEALGSIEDAMELMSWSTIHDGLYTNSNFELPSTISGSDGDIIRSAMLQE